MPHSCHGIVYVHRAMAAAIMFVCSNAMGARAVMLWLPCVWVCVCCDGMASMPVCVDAMAAMGVCGVMPCIRVCFDQGSGFLVEFWLIYWNFWWNSGAARNSVGISGEIGGPKILGFTYKICFFSRWPALCQS